MKRSIKCLLNSLISEAPPGDLGVIRRQLPGDRLVERRQQEHRLAQFDLMCMSELTGASPSVADHHNRNLGCTNASQKALSNRMFLRSLYSLRFNYPKQPQLSSLSRCAPAPPSSVTGSRVKGYVRHSQTASFTLHFPPP